MKLSINDINNLQAENEQLKEFIMGRPNKDKVAVFCKICICRACDEVKRLKDELSTYGATGICETCSDKANLEADKLKQENAELKADNDRIQNNFIQQLEYEKQALDDAIKYKTCLQ